MKPPLRGGFFGGGKGALYYQFGRKDPFPATTTLTARTSSGENTTSGISVGFSGTGSTRLTYLNYSTGTVTTAVAVQNPLKMYSGTSNNSSSNTGLWCSVSSTLYNGYLWYDITKTYDSGLKSIFDPSPAGWKVPESDWTSGASASTFSSYVTTVNSIARYPAHGNIQFRSVGFASVGFNGIYSSSRASSTTAIHHLYFVTGSITTNSTGHSHIGNRSISHNTGNSLRCVQE